ncbi:hypothetical protein GM921_00405 [Pedobacter sp. LMG 31464]|uniref:MG2 domain-containing protein n=1 Tax=Pedobacter planticolens TaxID=2679964 RepID=A0A923DWG1_9SPHI|nr:hypothetical protein [Pedobacter planticolens]MBB2143930.1 hypothetical protein [Pedobacter planticolens]
MKVSYLSFDKSKWKHFLILSYCLGISIFSYSQVNLPIDSSLSKKLALYQKAIPTNLLFVHTDKTLYTNNETLWFSAYLVKSTPESLKDHSVLSVAIVREDDRKVVLEASYGMQYGLSHGSLTLPDSIRPGNYQFIASTNVQNNTKRPLAIFTQSITIKSTMEQDFSASLTLLDTTVTNNGVRVQVAVNIKNIDPKNKQRPIVEYSLDKGTKQSAVLTENTYTIQIPKTQLTNGELVLTTAVKYNNKMLYLSTRLPAVKTQQINVRFFPEGGSLVEGLESKIGWEAKTSNNLPIAVNAILLEDGKPMDTVSTSSYGMGKFKVMPKAKSNYTLKILSNNFLENDTIYQFPTILQNGIVLQVPNAVINDTLRMSLFSREVRKVRVIVHNYTEDFASFSVSTKPGGYKMAIPLPAITKGLATVTILDEQGRPLAERLFFARYNDKITATAKSDKAIYGKKEKVILKLKLSDQTAKPIQGIVSLAVVQDNRLESSKQQDIESYVYLNYDLGNLPLDPVGRGFDNKAYLEDIFLIKSWRNYTWQAMMNTTIQDTTQHPKLPPIIARVKYNEKELKNPVILAILRDSLAGLVTTEPDGTSILNPNQLLVTEGRKVLLSINKKINTGYTVEIDDPGKVANTILAEHIDIPNRGIANTNQNSTDQVLKGLEKAIALQTVTINAGKDNSLYGTSGPKTINSCGDYVCAFKILNCPIHYGDSRNRAPVKGKTYYSTTGPSSVYLGCEMDKPIDRLFRTDGIYRARQFYGVDTSPDGLLDLQYLPTLFWKPGIITSAKGEAEFSFYTGDISGKFRIVVQGISQRDMIYGESSITVK